MLAIVDAIRVFLVYCEGKTTVVWMISPSTRGLWSVHTTVVFPSQYTRKTRIASTIASISSSYGGYEPSPHPFIDGRSSMYMICVRSPGLFASGKCQYQTSSYFFAKTCAAAKSTQVRPCCSQDSNKIRARSPDESSVVLLRPLEI